jgi:8-oxo-dGTP pyrophosphatase MutT (NUDIX family)
MTSIDDSQEMTPAIPSGTVAILRDAVEGGIEVLMLRRSAHDRDTFSGMWVFPGGKVDPVDEIVGGEEWETARVAAVRETQEEAGIELPLESLVALDRWEPEVRGGPQRRFSAWVFLAPANEGTVTIDGREIHEHDWVRPGEAIARHAAGEMGIVPPTWVTLTKLAQLDSVTGALSWATSRDREDYRSRFVTIDEEQVLVWHGDELHDGVAGDLHRLWMTPGAWRYERTI